jgi:hypothetical protein
VLAYCGVGVVSYWLGRQMGLDKPFATLAGLGALAAGRLVWLAPSGMETTAFTLSLLGLLAWGQTRHGKISPNTSLLFGLACLLGRRDICYWG